MNKTEKQFKKYMEETFKVEGSFEEIAKRVDVEPRKAKRKSWVPVLCGGLATAVIVGGVCLGLAGRPNKDEIKALVSIDLNPSIELVIDADDNVISVSGMNDEGKLVVAGEKILNKSLEEALDIIVRVESDTGYLFSGSVKAGDNDFKISVSADKQQIINTVLRKVSSKIGSVCDDLNIVENIQRIQKYSKATLQDRIVALDPSLEGVIEDLSYEELLKKLSGHFLETKNLFSHQLENLYIEAKNYNISFAEKEGTQNFISGINSAYQFLVDAYSGFVDSLSKSGQELEEARYNLFVNPESLYQKSLVEVNEAKTQLHLLKQEVATLEEGITKGLKEAEVVIKENFLSAAVATLNGAEDIGNKAIDALKKVLADLYVLLKDAEDKFPEEIQTVLKQKAGELETKLNEAKDKFLALFEKDYEEDIARIQEEVFERKEALKEAFSEE